MGERERGLGAWSGRKRYHARSTAVHCPLGGIMTNHVLHASVSGTLARSAAALLFAIGGVLVGGTALAADAPAGYHLVHTYKIAEAGGFWDYMSVDSDAHRLYISRGNHVAVMDTRTGKIVGDIPGGHVIHGIALAPRLGRGFVSDGTSPAAVIVFDLKNLKVLQVVKVPANGSDCIVYDPVSKRVFTFNGASGSATAIDAASGRVIGSIDLGGRPEFAVADGRGHLYNNLEDKSEELEIDTATLRITHRWSLAPCESPSGLAIDAAHRRLFVGCHNLKMAVVNADSGKVVTTLPIGAGVDANRYDPGTGLAFSSNGQAATLTVVREESPDQFTKLGDVTTEPAARTMAIDLKTHDVFLATANMGPRPTVATAQNPRRFPRMIAGTFRILEYAR